MRTAEKPFPKGSWIVCSGRVLGVLDRGLIQGSQPVDPNIRILVILPDNWESIQQNTLSAHTASAFKSSNSINKPPTTPRTAGHGGLRAETHSHPPSAVENRHHRKKLLTSHYPRKTQKTRRPNNQLQV
jgi:hypothetical protein